MPDFFSVFDYTIDECSNIITKTTSIHTDQRIKGSFSKIGRTFGHYVNFSIPKNLVVVGDIHGDFFTLKKILERIDFTNFLKNESNLLIFLGDYLDKNFLNCKLQAKLPENTHPYLYNHPRKSISLTRFLKSL